MTTTKEVEWEIEVKETEPQKKPEKISEPSKEPVKIGKVE